MNPDIQQLQKQIDDIQNKIDSLYRSSGIDRNVETAFRERLNPPKIIVDVIAPQGTPNHIGDIYINTLLHKVYVSEGLSSSSNWLLLN